MKNVLLIFMLVLFAACGDGPSGETSEVEFIMQPSGTGASLRGLAVIDENTAWVTGSGGAILKTTNSGKSWEKIIIPGTENLGFRDVHAWSAEQAIVMGIASPALFFKTSDGGKTWREVYRNENEKMFFDSIEFWNDNAGLAMGDPVDGRFFLLKTIDAGENWLPIDTVGIPKSENGEGGFAASGTCISTYGDSLAWFVTGGTVARVYKTLDQGNNWEVVNSPLISGLPSTGIFSVNFRNENFGIIVGGDYLNDDENNANAALTNDGGATWQLLDPQKPAGFKSCAVFLPGSEKGIITVGTSGTDISYDNGTSWNYTDSTSFNTIEFPARSKFGWAVGDNGIIARVIIK